MSEEVKTRKPRQKKSPREQAEALREKLKNAATSLAKSSLEQVNGFADCVKARAKHRALVIEGENLLDDEKFAERVASLETRLKNLTAKRSIAEKDMPRRKQILQQFDDAIERIGAYITEKVKKSEDIETTDLENLFNQYVGDAERKALLNTDDVYQAFRRKAKAEALENSVPNVDVLGSDED